jgi:hypothetical protein
MEQNEQIFSVHYRKANKADVPGMDKRHTRVSETFTYREL